VWDEVWSSGVAVDWSWSKANGYTLSSEPNNPTVESYCLMYNNIGLWTFGNVWQAATYYICEFA
jgi:hypothetical protein